MKLTQEDVHKLFAYSHDDGDLIWLQRNRDMFKSDRAFNMWNAKNCGKVVGSKRKDGYLGTRINGKAFLVHRLVWLFWNDELPEFIDHINGNRSDNRIENLRAAKKVHNNWNRGANKKPCKSRYKCVTKEPNGRWKARISVNGKRISLGVYETEEQAALAYNEAAEKHYGEFAKLNKV